MIDKIKDMLLKGGADDVVVTRVESENTQVKFVNNKIVNNTVDSSNIVDVFVAKNGRLGSTTIKDVSEKSVKKAIDSLMSFIGKMERNKDYRGIAKGPFKYSPIEESYDKRVEDLDTADLVAKGVNVSLDEGAKRVSGIMETSCSDVSLVSSNGVDVSDKKSSIYYSVRALVDDDSSGHMNSCSCVLDKLDVEGASKKAGGIASLSKNPVEGKEGKYDVVFSPLAFTSILNFIGEAASSFSVESGMSFLDKGIGKKFGNFTLVDDGRLANGFGSLKFDEEGRPTQTTKVIEDGVLKTYLHNTSSASRYNVEPTGNAGLIYPRVTNNVLSGEKGNVFDVKDGLYITNVWYTRFQNYASGEFSTIPRDGIFLIKNGEIGQSVKNIRVSDNMLEVMKNIVLMGKEKVHMKSWEAEDSCLLSDVLVKNVNISKPSEDDT
tara:strand:- start:430 stop:1734 length:1305 start_codon:yes stop_codon:yes gene_type:complete